MTRGIRPLCLLLPEADFGALPGFARAWLDYRRQFPKDDGMHRDQTLTQCGRKGRYTTAELCTQTEVSAIITCFASLRRVAVAAPQAMASCHPRPPGGARPPSRWTRASSPIRTRLFSPFTVYSPACASSVSSMFSVVLMHISMPRLYASVKGAVFASSARNFTWFRRAYKLGVTEGTSDRLRSEKYLESAVRQARSVPIPRPRLSRFCG